MLLPLLDQLPAPPPGKQGWPWTQEGLQSRKRSLNYRDLPRISVVTPSYNQAPFIEETIRSVLLQGYPNLEYIVIDGGSTDSSVEIIRKYEPWLTYWVSEPDRGQSDALNKGFQRSTGSIVAWINSDDSFSPGFLLERALVFEKDSELVLLYGDCYRINSEGGRINTWKSKQITAYELLMDGNHIPQQSTLIRATALRLVGGINHDLHFMMDYALWLKLSLVGRVKYLPGAVANFRKHPTSKGVSVGYRFIVEEIKWLSGWDGLRKTLSEDDQAEMFRRKHVMAALYAIFEGRHSEAAMHFDQAFFDGLWPFGDVVMLAQKIMNFSGMGGHTIRGSRQYFEYLQNVLRSVTPTSMRNVLRNHVASQYHFLAAQDNLEFKKKSARTHLFKSVFYNPRQLANRIFLYCIAQTFLSARVLDWLRHFYRTGVTNNER